ncbi:amino acid permease [Grosmannia clavigera kw1407]|uniref:Amino acid permease n=1 Tax=Grosmannia clavigera (strain kw1407 / UAMH 11150) TaxID=655863 RepID=F0XTM7_GROCL|nr:amino acid permease [Grosmannia clavigera kw1407]EFW98507.1 amino acid permease [Grosmannia clavigera kw1407]
MTFSAAVLPALQLAAATVLLTGAAILLYLRFFYVDIARVQGIPEVPGASLLYGHLRILGDDQPTTMQRWATQHGWPVFQIRLGNRRVIVLNGFDAARSWLMANQAHTIDRPRFYTFHGVVSKTSAATIGSNPWDERTKKQRRVVGSLTTAPAIRRLVPLVDLETAEMVAALCDDGQAGARVLVPHIYEKRLALNVVMMFCYGRRFDDVRDPLLHQILSDANVISSFRSTNANWQDYLPFLRYGVFQDRRRLRQAAEVRARRDAWLELLLQEVRDKIDAGTVGSCVAAGLLTTQDEKLTKGDVKTILGGLMSGGFETVFSTAIAGIAYLASPAGQVLQEKAYREIIETYGTTEKAFAQAVSEETCPYMVAFVRETLRHYPPLHLLPPRQTMDAFDWGDAHIPKGVMILVNTQAANHDTSTYGADADQFRPERWLKGGAAHDTPAPFQWAFGAGSRVCTAVSFSNRILYAAFVRLVVTYRIRQGSTAALQPCTDYVGYNRNTAAQSAIPRDYEATFALRDRVGYEACMARSRDRAQQATNGIVR